MALDLDAERDIIAARGLKDFTFFCKEILGLANPLNPKAGWWYDPVHNDLCEWLQKHGEHWLQNRHKPGAERLFLAPIMPRACGKTQIITQGFGIWLELHDTELSIYIGNESLEMAESFLAGIKGHMTDDRDWHLFKWCYGDWKAGANTWSKDKVEHAARKSLGKDPSFGTYSPTSGITGRHPDVAIMDDLVSYDSLKRDADWFLTATGALTDIIPAMERNGLLILPGTRYGDGDPYGRVFEKNGIASVSGHQHGPYKATPDGLWHVYFIDILLPDGTVAVPTCWSAKGIENYKKTDPVKYASQLRNDPKLHGLHSLTEWQFDTLLCDDVPAHWPITLHCDTAFRHTNRVIDGSETVLVSAAHDPDGKGRVIIANVLHSTQWRAEQYAEVMLTEYKRLKALGHRILAITDEQVPGGKGQTFEIWLRDQFTSAEEQMPEFYTYKRQAMKNKDTRISDAIAMVVAGTVTFAKKCVGIDELRNQLCNHPHSRRKDVADAFSDVFAPDFYIGRLPIILSKPTNYEPAAFETRLKSPGFWQDYDKMDDEEIYRAPLGRSR